MGDLHLHAPRSPHDGLGVLRQVGLALARLEDDVLERHVLVDRQGWPHGRVILAHQRDELDVEHALSPEPLARDDDVIQDELDLAEPHFILQQRPGLAADLDPDASAELLEPPQKPGQENGLSEVADPQLEGVARRVVEGVRLSERGLDQVERPPDRAGEREGARRRSHLLAATHEEIVVEQQPHPSQSAAHGWLGHAEALGCPCHVALGEHDVEHGEQVQVHGAQARERRCAHAERVARPHHVPRSARGGASSSAPP
ncbi:hypothetical protein BE20_41380 [Sorangium cellulosum]|uniref:Uncharacterized protein n=1 Tax=Sorangium cellulosum TaxID=56 RepID=A0A150R7N9_SORCE|nr:hypothetical protein BE18_26060 [Sorangium cellulosum]KYF96645.1 hypothetical protein BE20_41380 [Sorangium cellulosum]